MAEVRVKQEQGIGHEAMDLDLDLGEDIPLKNEEGDGKAGEEEEDYIVSRMPVFLNQNFRDKLYVLQHPLRPHSRSYDATFSHAPQYSVKPSHSMVKVEYPVASYTQSQSWDIARASEEEKMRSSTTFVLSSTAVPKKTNFAVAKFDDEGRELHLCPVRAIVRMRPDFTHIDRREEEEQALKRSNEQKTVPEETKPEAPSGPRRVEVTMKNEPTEKAAAYKRLTYAWQQEQRDKEAWIDLHCHAADTVETKAALARMSEKGNDGSDKIPFPMSEEEYLAQVAPGGADSDSLSMFLPGQFEATVDRLLHQAKQLHFRDLCLLANVRSKDDVAIALHILSSKAHLVQGCWVVHSERIITDPIVRRTRDMMIALLSQHSLLKRSPIVKETGLALDKADILFNEMCVKRPGKGWTFKLPIDTHFLESFEAKAAVEDAKMEQFRNTVLPEGFATTAAAITMEEE